MDAGSNEAGGAADVMPFPLPFALRLFRLSERVNIDSLPATAVLLSSFSSSSVGTNLRATPSIHAVPSSRRPLSESATAATAGVE